MIKQMRSSPTQIPGTDGVLVMENLLEVLII